MRRGRSGDDENAMRTRRVEKRHGTSKYKGAKSRLGKEPRQPLDELWAKTHPDGGGRSEDVNRSGP